MVERLISFSPRSAGQEGASSCRLLRTRTSAVRNDSERGPPGPQRCQLTARRQSVPADHAKHTEQSWSGPKDWGSSAGRQPGWMAPHFSRRRSERSFRVLGVFRGQEYLGAGSLSLPPCRCPLWWKKFISFFHHRDSRKNCRHRLPASWESRHSMALMVQRFHIQCVRNNFLKTLKNGNGLRIQNWGCLFKFRGPRKLSEKD